METSCMGILPSYKYCSQIIITIGEHSIGSHCKSADLQGTVLGPLLALIIYQTISLNQSTCSQVNVCTKEKYTIMF